MLIDTRTIAAHGPYTVLAQRFEVMWRDGSAVHLHPVCLAASPGETHRYLRAVQREGLTWSVFDLRHVDASIENDLITAHRSDMPGVVFFRLRLAYPNAARLLQAVHAAQLVTWWRDTSPQALAA